MQRGPARRQVGSAQLLMIVIVLVIFVVGGSLFYKNFKVDNSIPNPVSTIQKIAQPENFSTYSNSNLGFSLSYKKDLTVTEDSEEAYNKRGNGDFRKNFKGYVGYEPEKPLGVVAVLGRDNSFDNNPFTIWVFDNPNNLTADGWFDKYWYYPFLWGVFDYTSKGHIALDQEATVSGEMAKSKVVSYQPGQPKFIYVAKRGKMYLFRIIDDANHTGDQILSTFKFLK